MRHHLAGQLAVLAHHEEAAAEFDRQRRRHQEAARFDAGQQVRLVRCDDAGQRLDGFAPRILVRQQRRDVAKQDAGLRKVRHIGDVLLEIHIPPLSAGGSICRIRRAPLTRRQST